jgi:hypothetical protein
MFRFIKAGSSFYFYYIKYLYHDGACTVNSLRRSFSVVKFNARIEEKKGKMNKKDFA